MPNYKLIYFNAKGRAELTRWIFAYADIPYVDKRIEWADWPKQKNNYPGGKLPVLMVDDYQLPQSMAIARYVAKETGLVPKDNLQAAACDAIVDTIVELLDKLFEVITSSKAEAEKKKECIEISRSCLTWLNKRLEEKEWFVSGKLTWADFEIAFFIAWILEKAPEALEGFSSLVSHMKKVQDLPAIKRWIEKRPVTEY